MKRKVHISAYKDVASGLILRYSQRDLLVRVGQAATRVLKASLRAGRQPDGRSLPEPRDGGQPMRASGRLIASIGPSVKRDRGVWMLHIWAKGNRDDLGPKLRGRNASLLGVYIWGRRIGRTRVKQGGRWYRGHRYLPYRADPMTVSDAMVAAMDAAADGEVSKQLAAGKAELRTAVLGRRVTRARIDASIGRRILGR